MASIQAAEDQAGEVGDHEYAKLDDVECNELLPTTVVLLGNLFQHTSHKDLAVRLPERYIRGQHRAV